ncbi:MULTISPECIES: YdcH family protein [unclassified Shimia]|uniref:YdcH family protein n=1 Tax=unclassified Shimia TaxID=2630038 RepID=UPI00310585D9
MSNTPHELAEEFPEFVEKMSALKVNDAHFAKMASDYHDLNRKVHAAETNVAPREELSEVDLRKRRGALKDEIYTYLKAN